MKRISTALAAILLLGALSGARGQYVEDSIDVGGWGVTNLTYNASAGVVYGGCYYGHSFFAISCSTNEIVSQFPAVWPVDVAYAPRVNKAYCGLSNHGSDSIIVIDGTTHARIRAIPVLETGFFAIDTITSTLYFTCYLEDKVGVLDCRTDSVLTYISIPGEPVHLTINTRRRKLYCQNDYNMTVSVIDMSTNRVIRNIYTGSWYGAECYSEVADKYYCDFANVASGVTVIDGATDSVAKLIPLPQGYAARAMVSVESDSLVIVAVYGSGVDSVFTIAVEYDSIVAALPVGRDPSALERSAVTGLIYCANGSNDNLTVISSDGARVTGQVAVSDFPHVLIACPNYAKLYVGHSGETSMLYVVRDRAGLAEGRLEPESHPVGVTVVRGELVLPAFGVTRQASGVLLDASGRKVAELRPGRNDVRRLSPGVYFVRTAATPVRRVVVVR